MAPDGRAFRSAPDEARHWVGLKEDEVEEEVRVPRRAARLAGLKEPHIGGPPGGRRGTERGVVRGVIEGVANTAMMRMVFRDG